MTQQRGAPLFREVRGNGPTLREAVSIVEAATTLQVGPRGAIRLSDTASGAQLILSKARSGTLTLSHLRHPPPGPAEKEKLRNFFLIARILSRAVRKFAGTGPAERWTELREGAKRRIAMRHLWNLYDSFYRTETESVCRFLTERDTAALRDIERAAAALAEAGHSVSITKPDIATAGDRTVKTFIDTLREARNGEDLTSAVITYEKPESTERTDDKKETTQTRWDTRTHG